MEAILEFLDEISFSILGKTRWYTRKEREKELKTPEPVGYAYCMDACSENKPLPTIVPRMAGGQCARCGGVTKLVRPVLLQSYGER